MLFEQGGYIEKNIFYRDCDFNSVIQQFHEIASFLCVCLPGALMSLWIQQQQNSINEWNLNKQTNKEKKPQSNKQKKPNRKPKLCIGEKLR